MPPGPKPYYAHTRSGCEHPTDTGDRSGGPPHRKADTVHRKMPLALAGAVLTILAATLTLLPESAQAAVNRYEIKANSPKPEACNNHGTVPAGTWLQNKPCGYFIGTAMSGTAFDVHETTQADYHYGHNYGGNNVCAWIPPASLSSSPSGTAEESCSAATREKISHRLSFGSDFNAG
ncbi:MAG TPA: hypothetical protein VGO89_20300, partial [Streptomyces sp.]|nr:hypothetical protein [Streptomyces sp.]